MSKSIVKSEIQQPVIFRCTARCDMRINNVDLRAGSKFYTVKSDSDNGYYAIVWNAFLQRFVCGCPASTHDCKHVRGMQEILDIRKTRLAEMAERKEQVAIPALAGYDVVSESLKVVNQAMIDAKIGSHYEQVGAIYQTQQQSQLGSCDCCGYPVKPGFTTCSKCAGE